LTGEGPCRTRANERLRHSKRASCKGKSSIKKELIIKRRKAGISERGVDPRGRWCYYRPACSASWGERYRIIAIAKER
jgi:hypothetical protein